MRLVNTNLKIPSHRLRNNRRESDEEGARHNSLGWSNRIRCWPHIRFYWKYSAMNRLDKTKPDKANYILLPEFLGAGTCWLEWWEPALSRNELDSMIQENTMSEDFDGLRSWVEQLIKRETEV